MIKEIKSIKINKGITLISLVVTIIIILILAGVTIQVAVGESGLITKALDAVKGIKGARFQENVELALGEFRIDTALDKDGKENLKKRLEDYGYDVTEYADNDLIVYDKETGLKKKLDLLNGDIETSNNEIEEKAQKLTDSSIWDGTTSEGLIGEGTIINPYYICSAKDLAYMRDQVNSTNNITGLNPDRTKNGKDVEANTACYKLMTDIYLNDTANFDSWTNDNKPQNTWLPIGYVKAGGGNYFFGNFDGNNKKIVGAYIVKLNDNSNVYQCGIFGGLGGYGMILNLCAENTYIYSQKTAESHNEHIGAVGTIVAYIEKNSKVINCNVLNSKLYGVSIIGGIVGYAKSSYADNHLYIEKCSFNGEIIALQSQNNDQEIYIGGVAGEVSGSKNITVTKCYNTGKITIDNDSSEKIYVGGIAGFQTSAVTIENCYNTGNIKDNYGKSVAGGICGYMPHNSPSDSIIANCYNTGSIKGAKNQSCFVGKFDASSGSIYIRNCYNAGNIEGELISDGNVQLGWVKTINWGSCNIEDCYMFFENNIYKHTYKYDSYNTNETTAEKIDISNVEKYLFSRDFIVNSLNWDESIWNINENEYPTLK